MAEGVEKKIKVSRLINAEGVSFNTCGKCQGSGQITTVRNTILGQMQTSSTCPNCNGHGKSIDKRPSGTDSNGYFIGLTFPEVGPGSVSVGAATAGNFTDKETEYMTYEASYSYPVNDGLTVTPGVFIEEKAGDDLTGIFVKSSFSF